MLRWYILGVVIAIAIAWASAAVHASGHAPVGLTSVAVGALLGAALAALAAKLRRVGRRQLIVGAILISLVTVVAQHAWLYVDFRRQWHEAREESPQVALFREEEPWSPRDYFRHEATPLQMAFWCVDALLIAGSACLAAWTVHRRNTNALSVSSPQPPAPNP